MSPSSGRGHGSRERPLAHWGSIGLRVIAVCLAGAAILGLCSPASAAITRSGTLRAVVIDNFRTEESTTRYTLKAGQTRIPLKPTAVAAESGERVVVTGEMRDGRLVGEVRGTESEVAGQALTLGTPSKVAVILFTLPGDGAHSWSQELARSRIFTASNSVSAFYEEESYGQISLTGKLHGDGDVFGPFNLSGSQVGCPFGDWDDEADEAAEDTGADLTGYDHFVYIFPLKSACQWSGIAELGGSRININGNFFDTTAKAVVAHEFGHNFGLLHAGSWTCTSGGIRVQISDTCTIAEYGDPFDTMGNIGYRHNNGWNLDKLGLLVPQNVETVSVSGIYSLRSALAPTTEPTVLRIPRAYAAASNDVTSWYYLEIRQAGGTFENVSDASTTGVSVRATAEFNSPETLLLDANPATSGFSDAPLKVGQTLDGGPVQIKTLSAGGGQAFVEIEVDTEPPSPPVLQATVSADGVRLSWVSTDNVGVERYFVYRDGKVVTTLSTSSFLDRWAPVGDHDYVVVARDESRNESEPSEPLTVTVPILSGPTCSEGKCKLAYRYSGAPATWTVPPDVHDAFMTIDGAGGGGIGGGPDRAGGRGARVWTTLEPLTPGQVAGISIGGQGMPYVDGGAGGFNGGGDGGLGGGGGGYTTFELDSTLEVLAGGGGGGGLDGVNGTLKVTGGGGGAGGQQGSFFTRGANTSSQGATLRGGAGGVWGGAGGTGGAGGQVEGSTSCPGGADAGVSGAAGSDFTGGGGVAEAGGGGGGGYVGGGQGGGGASDECGAMAASGGGGGGSSFVAPGRSGGFSTASGLGDGWLSIEYDNPVGLGAHSYTTYGDQELDVPAGLGVLSGGSVPDGVSLTLVSPPDHGSLTLGDDGSFTYVPESAYLGTDSFDYRASDPAGHYAEATVVLNVAGPPSALISFPSPGGTYVVGQAVPAAFSCGEGTGGTGLSSCNDSTGATSVSGGAGHLDTATVGGHTYTVTAVSKTGLTGSASIGYTVVEPPPEPPEVPKEPPESPKDPPREPPNEPPLRIALSAGEERRSLRKLLRSGELVVVVRASKAAKVALTGRAKLRVRSDRRQSTKFFVVFRRKTFSLAGAGEKRVTLVLTQRGRKALRRLATLRLTITGEATDSGGEVAKARMALTLQR